VILLVGASTQSLLQAMVLETVNRVITVVFKFVPLRVGVDEAGSALLTAALGLGPAPQASRLPSSGRGAFLSGRRSVWSS
jgi:hypothetical protein